MTFAVTLAGRQVRRMIDAARDATVIASFRRSLYVRDASGGIACFGVAGLGAGPLNALCADWPTDPVPAGAPARWTGAALELGARWRFECGGAATWVPEALPATRDLSTGLRLLADLTQDEIPARGLGSVIGTLVAGRGWASADPFERAGAQAVRALAGWLAAPVGEPPVELERLIGLGPGLTPSGDDAFGGALIVLRSVGGGALADRLARWLLPRAATATSEISLAHLHAAAEGEGAAALHDALAALAAADRPALAAALRRLDAIGHSSGWDALAGAVAALTARA